MNYNKWWKSDNYLEIRNNNWLFFDSNISFSDSNRNNVRKLSMIWITLVPEVVSLSEFTVRLTLTKITKIIISITTIIITFVFYECTSNYINTSCNVTNTQCVPNGVNVPSSESMYVNHRRAYSTGNSEGNIKRAQWTKHEPRRWMNYMLSLTHTFSTRRIF